MKRVVNKVAIKVQSTTKESDNIGSTAVMTIKSLFRYAACVAIGLLTMMGCTKIEEGVIKIIEEQKQQVQEITVRVGVPEGDNTKGGDIWMEGSEIGTFDGTDCSFWNGTSGNGVSGNGALGNETSGNGKFGNETSGNGVSGNGTNVNGKSNSSLSGSIGDGRGMPNGDGLNNDSPNEVSITGDGTNTTGSWIVEWQKGDELGAWSAGDGQGGEPGGTPATKSFAKFTMGEMTGGKEAAFSGSVPVATTFRLLYPFDAKSNVISADNKYPIDLSLQQNDMSAGFHHLGSSAYMISGEYNEASVSSISMDHLTAFVQLQMKFTDIPNGDNGEGVRLLRAEVSSPSLKTSGKVDFTKNDINDVVADFNNDAGKAIVNLKNSPKLVTDKIYSVQFSILNTTFAANEVVTITVYTTKGYKEFDIITPSQATTFARGTHNYLKKICPLDNLTALPTGSWIGGGVANDPYLIKTRDDLAKIATNVNNGSAAYTGIYFKLMNDLDLGGASNPWTAIGTFTSDSDNHPFKGTFDGGGYSINGLYINQPTLANLGLFGYAGEGAVITNLSVDGSIMGKGFVGGVCGRIIGGTIANCVNRGDCSLSASDALTGENQGVGGICGYKKGGLVINCANIGVITLNNKTWYGGGICGVGYTLSGSDNKVVNCHNAGRVYMKAGSQTGGGIMGGSGNTSVVNCYNVGSIVIEDEDKTQYKYGAITGVTSSSTTFNSCYFLTGSAPSACSSTSISGVTTLSEDIMKGAGNSFLEDLNLRAAAYNAENTSTPYPSCGWKQASGSYPLLIFEDDPEPTTIEGNWIDVASPNFGGGNGSASNPYLISSPYELAHLASIVNAGAGQEGKYFRLTCDIDLSGKEWTAIGNSTTPFKGNFDGGNYTIRGLYIYREEDNQGLFGCVNNATIFDLNVTGSVSGKSYVGGICGRASYSLLSRSSYFGAISGKNYVGGICGVIGNSNIANSHNGSDVSATGYYTGGICGQVSVGTIVNSSNLGNVSGYSIVGGICGRIDGAIENCYSKGAITGDSKGGICGNKNGGITECYYLAADGLDGIGAGSTVTDVTLSLAETVMTGSTAIGGDGPYKEKSLKEALNAWTTEYNNTAANALKACGWSQVQGSYPMIDRRVSYETSNWIYEVSSNFGGGDGREESPYLIKTPYELARLAELVNGGANQSGVYFKLNNDINLSGKDWTAIGRDGETTEPFSGNFDGAGYTIFGLTINTTARDQGLFGYTYNATISNINLKDGSVKGGQNVGGICGISNGTTIINCSNSNLVTATIQQSGGIIGVNGGTIINCLNNGSIAANENAGGISGYSPGTITNCYSTGVVTATNGSNKGGICGFTFGYSGITNCYYLGTNAERGIGDVPTDTEATISLTEAIMTSTTITIEGSSIYNNRPLKEALITQAWKYNNSNTIKACGWSQSSGSYPSLAFGDEPIDTHWTDEAATEFGDGTGSSDTPYLITNPQQLAHLAKLVNDGADQSGKFFKLSNDINLSGKNWTAIGTLTKKFKGNFDGAGHTIFGLTINTTAGYQGLFGYTNNATISNVNLKDGSVKGENCVGGLCGFSDVGSLIINCTNSNTVAAEELCGGICGGNSGKIINCSNSGPIEAKGNNHGGICGVSAGTITNCYSTGKITGTTNGGICGVEIDESTITNCYYLKTSAERGIGNISTDTEATISLIEEVMKGNGSVGSVTYPTKTLLEALISGAAAYNSDASNTIKACKWVQTSGSYPTLEWGTIAGQP